MTAAAAPVQKSLILATTSTQETGRLDLLIPLFEKKMDYFVKTITVGSGQSMAYRLL